MCVGLSAKVVKIKGDVAIVDAGGARKTISSELLTDLNPGDYVMVHAGSAIARITSDDEDETDSLLEDL
ncbi:MAG: HypC/HybG/HupF family hydrogenase formation chaperone [Bilifractor sp.]